MAFARVIVERFSKQQHKRNTSKLHGSSEKGGILSSSQAKSHIVRFCLNVIEITENVPK